MLLVSLLGAGSAAAQVTSDLVPRLRTIPTQQQIDLDIEKSRYRLGPFYVLPLLSIRNLGYDSNVFGVPKEAGVSQPVSDWTVDVAAGARILQRLGTKMYLQAEALPEYSWYQRLVERRQFGGLYRVSWIGLFNRFAFEVDGVRSLSTSVLSTETLALVREDFRGGSAGLEVEAGGPLALFANARAQKRRYFTDSQTPAEVRNAAQLNRTEEAGRAGIRIRIRKNLDLTAAVEETQTRFETTGQQADNRSTAYLAGLHYDFQRFYLNLSGGYRSGRADNGSTFPSFNTGTGSYFISYFLTNSKQVELQAYGQRATSYGLTALNPYYFGTSNGGGLNVGIGRRLTLRGFVEYGINRYPVPVLVNTGVSVLRKDETTTYGGGFSYAFLRQAVLTARASSTRQVSNIPGLNRSVFQFSTSIDFQGDFSR